jgi:uncharacterized membrane protein (UPF0127 family)
MRGLGTLTLWGLLLAACGAPADGLERVRIGGETFRLELAADPETRRVGLMHRAELAPDGGMLFVFPGARERSFWMGHCRIDIDVLFLDARGRVTATHRMRAEAPQGPDESDAAYRRRLPRYPSRGPAQYAIELAAGSLDRLGVEPGDRIDLELSRLAARAR